MPAKGPERATNATLPLMEFQTVERLAAATDSNVAAFSRMLLRWALPQWREAYDALADAVQRAETEGPG